MTLVRQGSQPDPGEQVLLAGGSVLGAGRGLQGPQVAPDPTRGDDLWVQDSSAPVVLTDDVSGIAAFHQECSTTPDVLDPGSPSSDKGSPGLPQAPTNSRQIQHFTTNLRRRWPEHLAGGYDPQTRKGTGKGARLLAAALHAGCQIELVRVWYGSQARALEHKLKQRRKPTSGSLRAGAARSLKPLCPLCNPAGWWRRYPNLPDPPPPPRPRPRRFVPTWDADAEWNAAFPQLAYDPPAAAALNVGGAS
jgi:hypothetical protein